MTSASGCLRLFGSSALRCHTELSFRLSCSRQVRTFCSVKQVKTNPSFESKDGAECKTVQESLKTEPITSAKKSSQPASEKCIRVSNLTSSIDEAALETYFSQFGPLSVCNFVRAPEEFKSLGYATVAFVNEDDLKKMLAAWPHEIKGESIQLMSPHRVCVVKLPTGTTEESLREYFSKYGDVLNCKVETDSKGNIDGFVDFVTEEEMNRAMAARPHYMEGKWIQSSENQRTGMRFYALPLFILYAVFVVFVYKFLTQPKTSGAVKNVAVVNEDDDDD